MQYHEREGENNAMFLESREEEVRRVRRESLAKGQAIGLAKGEAIGRAKGEAMAKENAALGLLKEGLSAEIIAEVLDLRISEVHAIAACNGITLA